MEQKEAYDLKGLMEVIPLAIPKGHPVPRCKVCAFASRLCCANCKSQYCCEAHFRMDRLHSALCEHEKDMKELEKVFVPISEERNRLGKLREMKMLKSAQNTYDMALQALTEGENNQALLCAQYSLKVYQDIVGPDHEDTILMRLLISSCYVALNKFSKALNALSIVEHYLASRPNTSELVLGENAKMCGQLAMQQNKLDDAVYQFSDEVYHMSQHFGVDHHRTGVSLWRLGQSFLAMGKFPVTHSIYRQVIRMWMDYLGKRLKAGEAEEEEEARAVVSIGTQKKRGLLDQRTRTDGAEMLKDILDTRMNNANLPTEPMDLLLISYVNAMYHFATEDYAKSYALISTCTETLLPKVPQIQQELKDSIINLFKRARRRTPATHMSLSYTPTVSFQDD